MPEKDAPDIGAGLAGAITAGISKGLELVQADLETKMQGALASLSQSHVSKQELKEVIEPLAVRTELSEAIEPLATKTELAQAIEPLATKTEMTSAIQEAIEPLVTKSDLAATERRLEWIVGIGLGLIAIGLAIIGIVIAVVH